MLWKNQHTYCFFMNNTLCSFTAEETLIRQIAVAVKQVLLRILFSQSGKYFCILTINRWSQTMQFASKLTSPFSDSLLKSEHRHYTHTPESCRSQFSSYSNISGGGSPSRINIHKSEINLKEGVRHRGRAGRDPPLWRWWCVSRLNCCCTEVQLASVDAEEIPTQPHRLLPGNMAH